MNCSVCGASLVIGVNYTEGQLKAGGRRCRPCRKVTEDRWRAANPEKIAAARAKAVETGSSAAACRRWTAKNLERERERQRARRALPGWREAHAARQSARRAQGAVKLTSDESRQVKAFYEMAARLTKMTGTKYHVDHILPLARGGQHHPSNLVVMRADLNQSKGAQYWPWLQWFNEPPS